MYPILFEFGSVTIYSLWFFITIGFILGSLAFTHLCKRNRVSIALFTNNAFGIFLISLIVGRITFVATHVDLFFYNYDVHELLGVLGLWDKGISFWGSMAGLSLALYFYRHQSDEGITELLDMLTPAVLIGMIFGSFGAFLDGSFYGTPTELPWGVTFRSAYVKYISDIHPTQLYSVLYELLILVVLLKLLERLRGSAVHGLVTELGVTMLSFFIFMEEFLRGDDTVKILGIRLAQILAVGMLVIGILLLRRRFKNPSQFDPDHTTAELLAPFVAVAKKLHLIRSSHLPE